MKSTHSHKALLSQKSSSPIGAACATRIAPVGTPLDDEDRPEGGVMEELHRIDREVAELKGSILTEIRHLSHDIKNMMIAMTALMPRAEAERIVADLKEQVKAIETKLEARIRAHEEKIEKKFETVEEEKRRVRLALYGSIFAGGVSWLTWFLRPHT